MGCHLSYLFHPLFAVSKTRFFIYVCPCLIYWLIYQHLSGLGIQHRKLIQWKSWINLFDMWLSLDGREFLFFLGLPGERRSKLEIALVADPERARITLSLANSKWFDKSRSVAQLVFCSAKNNSMRTNISASVQLWQRLSDHFAYFYIHDSKKRVTPNKIKV